MLLPSYAGAGGGLVPQSLAITPQAREPQSNNGRDTTDSHVET